MSGICGFFNRDGAPHDAAVLSRMLAATPWRGPDGEHCWSAGAIAIAHQSLTTTPESRNERQPLGNAHAQVVITFDGRIDNRPELIADLGEEQRRASDLSDAALVLRAYERWREEMCSRLMGDFAFALWDGRRNALFAARDPAGVKPFYYFAARRCLAFGSEMAQLLRHPAVSGGVNEGMVAEYLTVAITSRDETLFADVRRLAPGHCLTVDSHRLSVRPYWDPTPGKRIWYRRDEDYREHFLELFRRAVADRLRCVGAPGISLSGGLDSPAIAGMAQALLVACNQRLTAFSGTLPGMPDDESAHVDSVVRQLDIPLHIQPYRHIGNPDWIGQVRLTKDVPDNPGVTESDRTRSAAANCKVRVLLSGVGAETWLEGGSYVYLDLLRQAALGAAVEEFRYQMSQLGARYALTRLGRSLAWPLVPRGMRVRIERKRSKPAGLLSPFLVPRFAERVGLEERLHRYDSAWRFANLEPWERFRIAAQGSLPYELEVDDRADARFGIESRYPFCDRRLVEFLMAVPVDKRRRTHYDKLLLRRSGLHPERVAWRTDGSNYGIYFEHALALEQVARNLSRLAVAENGWVQADRVKAAYDDFLGGGGKASGKGAVLWALWMVFAVELWYKVAVASE